MVGVFSFIVGKVLGEFCRVIYFFGNSIFYVISS